MKKKIQTLSEAINVAEGFTTGNVLVEDAREMFENGLATMDENDFEKKGEYYYYLLRIMFQKHMAFENPLLQSYYKNMTDSFKSEESRLLEELKTEKDPRKKSITCTQAKAFYKIMERFYSTLESNYHRKGFVDGKDRAFEQKMLFRKNKFKVKRNYGAYASYVFLEISSKYGLSFFRWGVMTFLIILFFAGIFYVTDLVETQKIFAQIEDYGFEYIYFSIVNFTTLGYGDFVPHTLLQRVIASVEVFTGYTMLGMFINLILKRL